MGRQKKFTLFYGYAHATAHAAPERVNNGTKTAWQSPRHRYAGWKFRDVKVVWKRAKPVTWVDLPELFEKTPDV